MVYHQRKINIREFVKDKTLFRFMTVGIVNTIIGTTVMLISYNLCHLSYWISSALNYIVGSMFSFFMNKYYTFHSHTNTFKSAIRFVICILICYLIAYGVAKPVVCFVVSGLPQVVIENISLMVGTLLFIILNYVGQRFWVF